MATVYILYSKSIDIFYTGSCENLQQRIEQHVNGKFKLSFTKKVSDWELFFSIDELGYRQARKIERHIKRMKSRKYIKNLLVYPEVSQKLIKKYR